MIHNNGMTARSHGVLWLHEITKEDTYQTGTTGVRYAELLHAGLPMTNGFVVTSQAYFRFLHENNLITTINNLLSTINYDYPESVQQISAQIKKRIMETKLSEPFMQTLSKTYDLLNGALHNGAVALHSELTHAMTNGLKTAKQTQTPIHGDANVLLHIKHTWASHFDPEALLDRHHHHRDHFQEGIAIVVQKIAHPEQTGIMLTQDPQGKEKHTLIIETTNDAPDHYRIDKKPNIPEILEKNIAGDKQKLSDEQLTTLATLGKQLEASCYFPQEVAWAIENGNVIIHHIRPLHIHNQIDDLTPLPATLPLMLKGIPASFGRATGIARIIQKPTDFDKIMHGEILVASQLDTTQKQTLKKAAGFVLDKGGRTAAIALFAREHGIPAVVGTTHATKNLRTGQLVTVDGTHGMIYQGALTLAQPTKHRVTATKMYVMEQALKQYEDDPIDGIFLYNNDKPLTITKTVHPIIYKLADNIPDNKNMLFGYHGTYRLLAEPKHLQKELKTIHELIASHVLPQMTILIPFVRSVQELREMKHLLQDAGITRTTATKLWMDIALPGNLIMLEEFIKAGIDGIAIDADTLTMLLLGTEHTDSFVSHAYDDLDPAVLASFETAIKTAQKHGITTTIYGHAPSHHPALIEKLVSWGITSICVEPERLAEVRKQLAAAERNLIEHK